MLVQRLPVTKARINLGAVLRRVRLNKEYFILEKDGIPVAGIMDIDEFEDYLELRDPRVRAHIRESYRQYLAGKSRPAARLLSEIGKRKGRNRKRAPRRRT
jgi:PHD/YefM family antitoxin component YafN of YafNO toxin-antitoxin module